MPPPPSFLAMADIILAFRKAIRAKKQESKKDVAKVASLRRHGGAPSSFLVKPQGSLPVPHAHSGKGSFVFEEAKVKWEEKQARIHALGQPQHEACPCNRPCARCAPGFIHAALNTRPLLDELDDIDKTSLFPSTFLQVGKEGRDVAGSSSSRLRSPRRRRRRLGLGEGFGRAPVWPVETDDSLPGRW